jgi:hypothetical protein
MVRAFSPVAMAHKIEELPIYSKVVEFWQGVRELLDLLESLTGRSPQAIETSAIQEAHHG